MEPIKDHGKSEADHESSRQPGPPSLGEHPAIEGQSLGMEACRFTIEQSMVTVCGVPGEWHLSIERKDQPPLAVLWDSKSALDAAAMLAEINGKSFAAVSELPETLRGVLSDVLKAAQVADPKHPRRPERDPAQVLDHGNRPAQAQTQQAADLPVIDLQHPPTRDSLAAFDLLPSEGPEAYEGLLHNLRSLLWGNKPKIVFLDDGQPAAAPPPDAKKS